MNSVDVALACADSNFTKASVTGTLAAEVRRQRREIEMLLEQRNDYMKGSADATTACIEYQQVIAELREENEKLWMTFVKTADVLGIDTEAERKTPGAPSGVFIREIERLRKDAEVDVDWLSNVIRSAVGNHSLGVRALAEKIVEAINAARGAK